MRIGLLCGSLGAHSANAAVLRVAAAKLRSDQHGVTAIDGLESIPPFDPGLSDIAPDSVQSFRRQLRDSDALLIAAPEYAAGLSGATKNALDWLVGDSTIYRKVIGVASAGTTGGPYAVEQLVRTISWQGGWVVATLGVAAPRTRSDEFGTFDDGATISEIEAWATTVVAAAEASPSIRRQLLTVVVARFGIDPVRFGDLE